MFCECVVMSVLLFSHSFRPPEPSDILAYNFDVGFLLRLKEKPQVRLVNFISNKLAITEIVKAMARHAAEVDVRQ